MWQKSQPGYDQCWYAMHLQFWLTSLSSKFEDQQHNWLKRVSNLGCKLESYVRSKENLLSQLWIMTGSAIFLLASLEKIAMCWTTCVKPSNIDTLWCLSLRRGGQIFSTCELWQLITPTSCLLLQLQALLSPWWTILEKNWATRIIHKW